MSAHRWRFLASRRGGNEWLIEGDEAQHATRVLRLEPGTEVEVTDGAATWAVGRLREARGKTLTVDAEAAQVEAPPAWRISVAVGALKPGVVDELLPGLVELGVDRIVVYQQRGAAKARLAASAVERWRRIVVSAMKQCKRATLPELVVYGSLDELVAAHTGLGVVLVPGAPEALFDLVAAVDGDLLLLAGGEKGLEPEEEAQLRAAGFRPAALGSTVLRAVTAALAAASVAALRRAARPC
jgi:16S rRNA (uracil1498-N3)-methyltransferase